MLFTDCSNVLSGTNRLDMLKIHDVKSMEDVYQMSQKGHLIDIFLRMKEEKVTCFIGFSGHGNADALKEMASRAKFDSMLIAMNHWNANQHFKKEEEVLPGGKKKKMGILLMKAVPPKELKVIVIHGAMTFFPGE